MKFRAVLFDAAETLFTTRGSVGEIYGGVARAYGSTASTDAIEAAFLGQFRHSGPISSANEKAWWKDVVHSVFSEVGMVRNFDEFFDQVYDGFRDSQGWILFPETPEVLTELKGLNIKLGVISNFDDRAYSVMRSLGILRFFDAVTLSSETGYCKPDPQIFHSAVRALGVPAAEILMVGDHIRDDVEAARQAGITALLIDRTGRHEGRNHIPRISSLKEVVSKIRRENNV